MAKIVTAAFKKCKNFLVEKASNFREAASNATGKGRLTKEGEGRIEEGKSGGVAGRDRWFGEERKGKGMEWDACVYPQKFFAIHHCMLQVKFEGDFDNQLAMISICSSRSNSIVHMKRFKASGEE
jgi:hypothetical protein